MSIIFWLCSSFFYVWDASGDFDTSCTVSCPFCMPQTLIKGENLGSGRVSCFLGYTLISGVVVCAIAIFSILSIGIDPIDSFCYILFLTSFYTCTCCFSTSTEGSLKRGLSRGVCLFAYTCRLCISLLLSFVIGSLSLLSWRMECSASLFVLLILLSPAFSLRLISTTSTKLNPILVSIKRLS